jgi:hypothetical protein
MFKYLIVIDINQMGKHALAAAILGLAVQTNAILP